MSSTNGKDKQANDRYETPVAHVLALLKHLRFKPNDKFLEPCKAGGNIFDNVRMSSARKYWAELEFGVDYLTTEFPQMDVIITNPPFTLTEEFLIKSFSELASDGTLAYLQRVNYLGSAVRLPFWAEVGFPDKTPVLVPRPKFIKGGSDSCEYMWMIWDKGGRFTNIPTGLSHLIDETAPVVKKLRAKGLKF